MFLWFVRFLDWWFEFGCLRFGGGFVYGLWLTLCLLFPRFSFGGFCLAELVLGVFLCGYFLWLGVGGLCSVYCFAWCLIALCTLRWLCVC